MRFLSSSNKFKKIFGFHPFGGSSVVNSTEQKIVDEHLQGLASTFGEADRKERALQADLEGTEGQAALLALREKAWEIGREVEIAKIAFWLAHKLAKEAGFSVKETYTNYLMSTAGKYR